MKIEVGKKAIFVTVPSVSNYVVGQVVTVTKIDSDMVCVDNSGTCFIYLHRLRPFTPLDEALS